MVTVKAKSNEGSEKIADVVRRQITRSTSDQRTESRPLIVVRFFWKKFDVKFAQRLRRAPDFLYGRDIKIRL